MICGGRPASMTKGQGSDSATGQKSIVVDPVEAGRPSKLDLQEHLTMLRTDRTSLADPQWKADHGNPYVQSRSYTSIRLANTVSIG